MKFGTVLLFLVLAVPAMAQRRQGMDTNNDGRISREEWKGRADVFDRLDTNHDGYLTRDESPRRRPDMKSMDTNGDGNISKDEWKGPVQMFDRLDSNHDGSITREEMRDARGRREKKN